jgi:hypothetical protein
MGLLEVDCSTPAESGLPLLADAGVATTRVDTIWRE